MIVDEYLNFVSIIFIEGVGLIRNYLYYLEKNIGFRYDD